VGGPYRVSGLKMLSPTGGGCRGKGTKAKQKNVLTQYGKEMKKLLKAQKYNAGPKASGTYFKQGSLTDHGGAIRRML